MELAEKYLSEYFDEHTSSTNAIVARDTRRSSDSLQLTRFVTMSEEHIEQLLDGEMLRMHIDEFEVIVRARLEWKT